MYIQIAKTNEVLTYDNTAVYIGYERCASYTTFDVTRELTKETFGKISRLSGNTYGETPFYPIPKVRCNIADHTIRIDSSNIVVATYKGTPIGAVAGYLLYEYLEYKKKQKIATVAKASTVTTESTKKVEKVTSANQTETKKEAVKSSQAEKPKEKVNKPKEDAAKPSKSKKIEDFEEPIIPEIQTRRPREYEDYKEYKVPEYKRDFSPPNIPVPSGGNSEESGGCLGGFAGIAILFVIVAIAIHMIPDSWRDLGTFIPKGDIGIIICFFSAVIGAIIALVASIVSKIPMFAQSMMIFLSTCGIGIIVNVCLLLSEIFSGNCMFTGFFLFDIPLAIFAPILGSFQFAFPIGIALAIICGIIHLIKKHN